MTDEMVLESPADELDGINLLILRQMAESIRIAHEINPRSWAVYETPTDVVFNVASNYVLTTVNNRRSTFSLAVMTEDIDPELLGEIEGKRDPDSPKTFPGWRIMIPATSAMELLPRLKQDHEAAVRWTSLSVRTRSARANEHRPDVLHMIETAIGESLPRPEYAQQGIESITKESSKRYWKVSAGVAGREWPNFQDRSVIALDCEGKGSVADLPDDRSSFVRVLIEKDSLSSKDANSLWSFAREIKINDQVVNTSGLILRGIGRVVGEYEYVIDDFSYPHRRRVDWEVHQPADLDYIDGSTRAYLSRRASILPLTENQFSMITRTDAGENGSFAEPAPIRNLMDLLRENFANAGLFYTQLQLATFYTALQTKGFVVLSGISGTGKTKIAQQFASMLPEAETFLDDEPDASEGGDSDSFTVRIGRTTLTRHGLAVPLRSIPESDFPELGTSTYIPLTVNGKTAPCRFNHRLQPRGYQYSRLHIPPELREAVAKLTEGARYDVHIARDDSGKISGFELGNLNTSTRPSRTSQDSKTPNSLFLSVRPDWRDSRALIGYYNPLLNQYEWTDFLRFVIRAAENYWSEEPIAWFVILDEMNLAHVEYYFADLLSILESGRDEDGWTREAIRITVPELEDDADAPPSEIWLPPNLYFIGTVNMDETTHAFSPKVLDRAFTMELSDVDFSHYPQASDGDGCNLTEGESSQMLRAFTRDGRFAKIDKAEIGSIVTEYPNIRVWLQKLNELLAKSRMNFGYRVFDEIAQFIANAEANDGFASFEGFESAFDSAVLMKVLPKFSGSAARLERPLLDLLAWCVDPVRLPQKEIRDAQDGLGDRGWLESSYAEPGALFFPLTGKRAMRMLDALATEGFASFG